MKHFSGAMLAASVSGFINQGYHNPSLGGSHGYGYGIGNGFKHGDSHGNQMAHQTQFQYGVQDSHSHIIGYDSIEPIDDAIWAAIPGIGTGTGSFGTINTGNLYDHLYTVDAVTGVASGLLIDLNAKRAGYLDDRMIEKEMRLSDIHDDNLVKIQAPFTLQLDLLEEEKEDLNQAKNYAVSDAGSAFTDLFNRMERFLFDRQDALMIEADRVFAVIERAIIDQKPVQDVVYAMRLDWLQGLYVSGDSAFFDKTVYDMHHYDTEFDLFTYDIGHGKGHGHHNQGVMGPQNNNNGFVKGEGIQGRDLQQLRAAPAPVDGKTRRYDRATLGGDDYVKGVAEGQRGGSFGYDQAAQEQVRGPQRRVRRGRRSQRPSGSRPAGYGRKPAGYSRSG